MIPFHIETLYKHEPWANWLLLGTTAILGVAFQTGTIPTGPAVARLALGEGGGASLFAHILAHPDAVHLLGNAVFLWVLGNALCGTLGCVHFLTLCAALGGVSGLAQLALGGSPVVGASGVVAGLLGVCVVTNPINNVTFHYPHGIRLGTMQAPLWMLAPYWLTWESARTMLALGPAEYWAQATGIVMGSVAGFVIVGTGMLADRASAEPTLLDIWQSRSSTPVARASNEAREELRRMALAYYEEYASLPAIVFGASPSRRRLTLRRSMAAARSPAQAEASAPAPRGASSLEPATPTAPLPTRKLAAWPSALPEGYYFYFDGTRRHGPVPRPEFIASLSLAIDTSRWQYWTEGMPAWEPVANLERVSEPRPEKAHRPLAPRRAHPSSR